MGKEIVGCCQVSSLPVEPHLSAGCTHEYLSRDSCHRPVLRTLGQDDVDILEFFSQEHCSFSTRPTTFGMEPSKMSFTSWLNAVSNTPSQAPFLIYLHVHTATWTKKVEIGPKHTPVGIRIWSPTILLIHRYLA